MEKIETFKVHSSSGELTVNKSTGEVIHYDCNAEIASIARFDVMENVIYHKAESVQDDVDILDMGYWFYTKTGLKYEEPAHDWREELKVNRLL